MRLKMWVKVVLVIGVVVMFHLWFSDYTKKEVRNCIENGRSREYCEYELYK